MGSPTWIALNTTTGLLYVLDTSPQLIWVFDTSQPSGSGPVNRFDISSVSLGDSFMVVDPSNNTLWFTDAIQGLYAVDGTTGAISFFDVSANVTGAIITFTLAPEQSQLWISDAGGNVGYFTNSAPSALGPYTLVNSGVIVGELNATQFNVSGFTPTGIVFMSGQPFYASSDFALETNPISYSACISGLISAQLTVVSDVHGTGNFELSVWDNGSAIQNAQEQYRYAWPGSSFQGFLATTSGSTEMYGLDTVGNLYTMSEVGPNEGTGNYSPPDWTPTFSITFPEPGTNIVVGSRVWTTGQLAVYGYNASSGLIDYEYPFIPQASASIAGSSGLFANAGPFTYTAAASIAGDSAVVAVAGNITQVVTASLGGASFILPHATSPHRAGSTLTGSASVTCSGLQVQNITATLQGGSYITYPKQIASVFAGESRFFIDPFRTYQSGFFVPTKPSLGELFVPGLRRAQPGRPLQPNVTTTASLPLKTNTGGTPNKG